MITGEKPFPGQNITTVIYKIVNEDPVSNAHDRSNDHAGLSTVVMKALAKDPQLAIRHARKMLEDLKNYRSVIAAENPSCNRGYERLAGGDGSYNRFSGFPHAEDFANSTYGAFGAVASGESVANSGAAQNGRARTSGTATQEQPCFERVSGPDSHRHHHLRVTENQAGIR